MLGTWGRTKCTRLINLTIKEEERPLTDRSSKLYIGNTCYVPMYSLFFIIVQTCLKESYKCFNIQVVAAWGCQILFV